MKLDVQYQFEDYREAHAAHSAAIAQPTEPQKMLFAGFMIASIAAYIACVELCTSYFDPSASRPRLSDQAAPMIPWVAILAALWLYQFSASRKAPRAPWEAPYVPEPKNKAWRSWKPIAMPAGMLVMLAIMIGFAWKARRPGPSDVLVISFAFSMVPWQIYSLWVATMQKATTRRAVRLIWARMPQHALPHTINIADEGMVVECETHREEYKWSGIIGHLETTNLFLLYPSHLTFHMVPKRGFPTDADLDLFYSLLQRSVTAGRFLPRAAGFPVQPVAPVQPRGDIA